MQIRSASNTNEVNWDDPLNKGLVAWFPMTKATGDKLFDVTSGIKATLYDGFVNNFEPSPETKSLSILSSSSAPSVGYAQVIDDLDSKTANWTVSFTEKRTSTGVCRWFDFYDAGSGDRFIIDFDGGIRIYDGAWRDTNIPVDRDVWNFITVTSVGGEYIVYLDGIEAGSAAAGTPKRIHGTGAFNANNSGTGNKKTNLYLTNVRFYSRPLSGSEVHDLYQASRTGYVDQYKRRYFPVSLQTEEPPVETASTGLIRLKSPKQTQPSSKAGYAKSASESAYPELWQDLAGAWIPQMGQSGDMLLDLSGHGNNGTFVSSPSWRMIGGKQSLFFDGVDDRVDIQNVEFGTEFTAIIAKDLSGGTSALRYMLAGQDGASIEWILWQYSGKSAFTHSGSEINTSIRTDYRVLAASHQPDNLNVIYQSAAASPGQITASASGTFEYTGASKGSLIIGGRTTDNNRNWEGDVYAVLFYNRALAFNELQTIRADPLAPFRQRRYAPVSLQTEAPSFNHWYAIPGRINRIVGSGVHV